MSTRRPPSRCEESGMFPQWYNDLVARTPVPPSPKTQALRAYIADLERWLAVARAELAAVEAQEGQR